MSPRMIEFRVMTATGSGAVEVLLMGDELRHYFEEPAEKRDAYVKHMAWRNLFKTDAGKMLIQLIEEMGVDRVKKTFNNTSTVVEIARG